MADLGSHVMYRFLYVLTMNLHILDSASKLRMVNV